MKVHEIMTAHARCAGPENNLVEAAGLMREMDVGALPVCDNDRIAGMVTDRDIVVRAIADGRDPNDTVVREVMTPHVVYVFADQSVEEAARIMEEREVRRLPVLNRQKRLVGVLSLGDVAVSSNPAFSGITLREVSQSNDPDSRDRKREAMGRAATGVRPMLRPGRDGETEADLATGVAAASGGRRSSRRGTSSAGTGTRARSRGPRQQRQRKATSSQGRKSASRGGKSTRGTSSRQKATARSKR